MADAKFRNFDPFFIASESRRNFAYQRIGLEHSTNEGENERHRLRKMK